MNKPISYILLVFLLAGVFSASAQQKNRVVFRFGAAADYYYGANDIDINQASYDRQYLFADLNLMLGFLSQGKRDKSEHIFGVFGRAGFVPKGVLLEILDDQDLTYTLHDENTFNDFKEVEAGVLLGKTLRISAGYGWLNFFAENNANVQLNYYCATAGLSVPVGVFRINAELTMLKGKDFQTVVYRPSVGLVLHLN